MKNSNEPSLMNHEPSKDWDDFLSSAATLSAEDQASTDKVLGALRLERERATDPAWVGYLSSAASLQPLDYAVVQPTLDALNLERNKRRILRLNLTRAFAGFAAAAVAAVALVILIPSPSKTADASEAYRVYQEANVGW